MKLYPFILINKCNMRELLHFPSADKCALHLFPKTGVQIASNFVIVKDEAKVVDLTPLTHMTALPIDIKRRLLELLNAD
jgi:hypothetical protein